LRPCGFSPGFFPGFQHVRRSRPGKAPELNVSLLGSISTAEIALPPLNAAKSDEVRFMCSSSLQKGSKAHARQTLLTFRRPAPCIAAPRCANTARASSRAG
jgi:hypothetical protein